MIVVARGGGSLADLFCFCDETLCRTVAMLGVPVIASVGHHTDRTLIDDVAALSCSTPTHAAESAVPVHCAQARADLARVARRLHVHGERVSLVRPALLGAARRLSVHSRRALLHRAQALARLSHAPGEHVARERARLHQTSREMRASGRRRAADERSRVARRALVLDRKAQASALDAHRASGLQALALALAAHDPARTLERGYALVTDRDGEPVTTAAAARKAQAVALRFADAAVDATICADDDRA